MNNSEPQGCLAAILGLIGIRIPRSANFDRLPYRQRDDFLSAAEFSFYGVLCVAIDRAYTICPKVNLADVFFVAGSTQNQTHRNRINQKHVDFLLCDPRTMRPLLGIELDDSSHSRQDRQVRDELVNQVFQAAGLPILRIRVQAEYSTANISGLIRDAIGQATPLVKSVGEYNTVPICPKCHITMVIRTARKGPKKDASFWGCQNYPKCRETLQ